MTPVQRADALARAGYRWTREDHDAVLAPVLARMAHVRLMESLNLRDFVGWKLCNQHGKTCIDPLHSVDARFRSSELPPVYFRDLPRPQTSV